MMTFTNWPGGDAAPEDWDRGRVLLRSGALGYGGYWHHDPKRPGSDIVGYRQITPTQRIAFKLADLSAALLSEHPDDVAPLVEQIIADLRQWCDDNGYVTPDRLRS